MGGQLAILAAEGGYQSYDSSGPGWFFGGFFVLWGALMLLSVAGYVFGIWALVEILRYREDEFAAVGLNRTTWLVLQIVGLALCQPMGAVVGVLFLWKKRPILREWRQAHPVPPMMYLPYGAAPGHPQAPGYPAPPGYPPQGAWAPPGYPPPGAQAPPPPPPPPPTAPPSDPWGGSDGPGGGDR